MLAFIKYDITYLDQLMLEMIGYQTLSFSFQS